MFLTIQLQVIELVPREQNIWTFLQTCRLWILVVSNDYILCSKYSQSMIIHMEINTMNDYVYNRWLINISTTGLLVTYVLDNPTTGNDFGDEGAKHLNLPANLQTLDLECKQWLSLTRPNLRCSGGTLKNKKCILTKVSNLAPGAKTCILDLS